jgi:hypothetical protein
MGERCGDLADRNEFLRIDQLISDRAWLRGKEDDLHLTDSIVPSPDRRYLDIGHTMIGEAAERMMFEGDRSLPIEGLFNGVLLMDQKLRKEMEVFFSDRERRIRASERFKVLAPCSDSQVLVDSKGKLFHRCHAEIR